MKRKRSPGVARSFEEVRWVAYLLDTLGLNVSPQSVVAALHDGTRHNLFDMYTALGEDLHLYGDYDGGYYHNEHRVNRDRTKTLRIIEDDERAVVLRTRVRAAHLSVEDDHVCVVETKSSKIEDVIHATARALQGYLPEPYASRLKNVQPSKRRVAEHAAEEAWKDLHRVFAAESDALERHIGRRALLQLMRVNGVRTRMEMGGFSSCVWNLCAEFHMTTQLVTFMSDCVAARLENPPFMTALRALRDDFEMTTPQLVTFMSNCVATRLENPPFMTALRALRDDFQMTTPQLVTFMSGCVAARLENPPFMTALRQLHSSMPVNSFLTIVSDDIISSRIQNIDFTNVLIDQRTFARRHIRELARTFEKMR